MNTNTPEQSKRKTPEETDSPRKEPKLLHDAFKYSPRPQSSTSAPHTSPATAAPPAAMILTKMNAAEREKYYESKFSNQAEPLHILQFPSLASEYPLFAAEINAAYLRHTTFVVKVWINYDAMAERFYYDDRASDCGTLRLSQKDIDTKLKPNEFGKIRFEVRTPFTYLARITIGVESTKLSLGPRIQGVKFRYFNNPAPLFADTIWDIGRTIQSDFEVSGAKGLNYDDIVTLAACFKVRPRAADYNWGGWLKDTTVWMNHNRSEERNFGHVYGLPEA